VIVSCEGVSFSGFCVVCVCVGFERIDGVVCILLDDSVARVLF